MHIADVRARVRTHRWAGRLIFQMMRVCILQTNCIVALNLIATVSLIHSVLI